MIMKHVLYAIMLGVILSNSVFCQNKDALIKEAEEKLKTGQAGISQVLTDKKYDAIHPETVFRNIIEKYCKAEIISIVTDTIPGKKIIVTGTVKDPEGKPVDNALVYLYHTDS